MDDVVETNQICSQTKDLSTIQFGNMEHVVLLEHELLNPIIQERCFLVTFFDKITISMTSCSKVEEETDK